MVKHGKGSTENGKAIAKAWLGYTRSEKKLRDIMELSKERIPVLNRFGEFIFCQFFGGQLQEPNKRGYDVMYRGKRIQIKSPRKQKGNKSALKIDINIKDCGFDKLAVFGSAQIVKYVDT